MKENELIASNEGANEPNSHTREPFFIVPSRVFELDLNPYELSVLFYLMMRADNETHTCFPSEKGIARACGMGKTSVGKNIKSLAEKGIIEKQAKYQQSKNGLMRQTANNYKINIYIPPRDRGDIATQQPPYHKTTPPISPHDREINKTKPNITKNNITISTITTAEAVGENERKSFLDLKGFWFENLKKEKGMDQEEILLLDKALDHLWFKRGAEYEGQKYTQNELWGLLCDKCTPEILASSVEFLLASKEPVRSPVAYLGKCILGGVVKGFSEYKVREPKGNNGPKTKKAIPPSAVDSEESSFDVNDFFTAAMRSTYGEDFKF